MRIALDAMGGDHAPEPIVIGAVQALQKDEELEVVLVGDQAKIEACFDQQGSRPDRIEIVHSSQAITMEESPVEGLRKKPDNSISRCWGLLKEEKVKGIVSAGNTGAVVAGGLFSRRFLKNVRRPGIAAILPTLKGLCIMIDVGANVSPKAEHLFQYGIMGSLFAKQILQKEKPTIGLMNVGSEEQKGNELSKETHRLFNQSSLKEQFVGNIEGRDINQGDTDVVVSDGFVGNIVLKTCEGVFDFTLKLVAREILPALGEHSEKAKEALFGLAQKHDYSTSGGAPLLGIDGICIICHGSSKERAIKNALVVAAQYARSGVNELIVKELEANPTS